MRAEGVSPEREENVGYFGWAAACPSYVIVRKNDGVDETCLYLADIKTPTSATENRFSALNWQGNKSPRIGVQEKNGFSMRLRKDIQEPAQKIRSSAIITRPIVISPAECLFVSSDFLGRPVRSVNDLFNSTHWQMVDNMAQSLWDHPDGSNWWMEWHSSSVCVSLIVH